MTIFGADLVIKRLEGRPRWAAGLPGAVVWFPIPTAVVAAVSLVARRVRRRSLQRKQAAATRTDVVALAELTALGLAAGLDFAGSLEHAAEPLSADVRDEVRRALRRARISGLSAALAEDTGPCRRLFQMSARAVESGAPVWAAVEAFVDDGLAEQHSRDLVAIRRLPVKLLFPLSLLILPGFMVLTIGPALLGSIQRLAA
jgi:hypothetical protein